jgi:hypothetical protein
MNRAATCLTPPSSGTIRLARPAGLTLFTHYSQHDRRWPLAAQDWHEPAFGNVPEAVRMGIEVGRVTIDGIP